MSLHGDIAAIRHGVGPENLMTTTVGEVLPDGSIVVEVESISVRRIKKYAVIGVDRIPVIAELFKPIVVNDGD